VSNALLKLLALPEIEKQAKGIAHTPREIHQQPETWRKTFQDMQSLQARLELFLEESGVSAASAERPDVLLVGAGTSDYTGRSLSRLIRQQWQCEVMAVPSTEMLTNMPDYLLKKKKYLWISFSRSGESSEGVAVLEQALLEYPDQVSHLVITCNRDSAMAKKFIGHKNLMPIILDDAVNDRGLAMTSSFSNMVLAGQYLAYIQSPEKYVSLLEDLIAMGNTLLPAAADLTFQLAKTGFSKICFLGTGALHTVAEESALKVMELTAGRVQTLTQSFLGLRHGPLSSLNDETLIVAYISNDPLRARYEMDLLKEIKEKRLGQATLAVTPSNPADLDGLADFVLSLDAPRNFPDACRPPVDAIVGQLLGLFSSMQLGIQPDTPSPGGVITRVVSHVKIYSPEAQIQ
jgi:tagatose-6-phosphate ketose/aldose isomerase